MPINCPYRSRVANGQRDGWVFNKNQGSKPNYHPNTKQPYEFSDRHKQSTLSVRGNIGRYKVNHPNCDFAQPGELYRKVMNDFERDSLVNNLVGHLGNARKDIQER